MKTSTSTKSTTPNTSPPSHSSPTPTAPTTALALSAAQMELQIKAWGESIDAFSAKVGKAAKRAERKLIAELREKHEVVQTQLDDFRLGGRASWETVKDGVEGAFHELSDAIQKLVTKDTPSC